MIFTNILFNKSIFNCRYSQQQVKSYETSQYKMNYLETPTGLKMVLNTDPSATGIPELMRLIYQVCAVSFFVV